MVTLSPHKFSSTQAPVELIDLKEQQRRIRPAVDAAIARVLDHGQYIMGPEVAECEQRLARYCGSSHVISSSSGTDALLMILMAIGIGPGDAVICPAFTFTATPEVIALLGATPVFADVQDETFNLAPERLPAAIATALKLGLTPRVVMPVDLYGQPADYDLILPIAEEHGLFVLGDAAQSFGAEYRGRRVGRIAHATATSFFPAKPLGCYGDGGAIFTDDGCLAEKIRSIRLHGKGADKYDITRIGINGRLDTMQAAILIEKLKIFSEELEARDRIALRYNERLGNHVAVPRIIHGCRSAWAQYTLRFPEGRRDAIAAKLKGEGIPTAVYYPRPVHHQAAYAHFPVSSDGVPVSTRLAGEVLSLPMHPYLAEATQDRIIDAVLRTL